MVLPYISIMFLMKCPLCVYIGVCVCVQRLEYLYFISNLFSNRSFEPVKKINLILKISICSWGKTQRDTLREKVFTFKHEKQES